MCVISHVLDCTITRINNAGRNIAVTARRKQLAEGQQKPYQQSGNQAYHQEKR